MTIMCADILVKVRRSQKGDFLLRIKESKQVIVDKFLSQIGKSGHETNIRASRPEVSIVLKDIYEVTRNVCGPSLHAEIPRQMDSFEDNDRFVFQFSVIFSPTLFAPLFKTRAIWLRVMTRCERKQWYLRKDVIVR